jgi:ATP-dependent RNA helicase DDX1
MFGARQAYDREPAFAISADGLLCQARDENQWQGGRATVSVTKGKHYYEATMTDEGGCARPLSARRAVLPRCYRHALPLL